jgi:hypothetical protein
MMRVLVAVLLTLGVARAVDPTNVLRPDLRHILDTANSAVLYSLEPNLDRTIGEEFCGIRVLGKTTLDKRETDQAAAAFETAVADWDGSQANCFNPRHGLRVTASGHIYDFLLCYECRVLEIFKDGKSISDMGAQGPSKVLNDLLRKHHLPLSHSGDQESASAR